MVSIGLMVIVIAWTIAFFLTNTFQDIPVQNAWAINPTENRSSIELTKMFLSQSYIDVATDVLIVSLPIPISKYPTCKGADATY